MIAATILLFALAAMLGVIMLGYLLTDRHIPKGLAFVHGPLAVAGVVTLLIYSICAAHGAWTIIGVFLAAALGGLLLLYKDLSGKAPKWLGVVHGLVAVAGFILLLIFAFHHQS